MPRNETAPVLIRLAKLESQLRDDKSKRKNQLSFLSDPSRLISIAAFLISVVTTGYSFRKDAMDAQAAHRKELDSTIQQMIDVGIKTYELNAKNKNDPSFGTLAGWFNAESGFLAERAAASLADVHGATTIDYLLVGNALTTVGNYSKASEIYSTAIKLNAQNVASDQSIISRTIRFARSVIGGPDASGNNDTLKAHDLASAYITYGSSLYGERKADVAAAQFEEALRVIAASSYPADIKDYQSAWTYKSWSEAVVQIDCNLSQKRIQTAANLFPSSRRFTDNPDWKLIQYESAWLTANCGPDGKLQGNWTTPAQQPIPSSLTTGAPPSH